MTGRADVVVIGGGIAGLLAAIEARQAGADTVLLDARRSLGGRARTDAVGEALLNRGPHGLYVRGALAEHLARLGIVVAGRAPASARTRFRTADALHRLPASGQRARLGRLLGRAILGTRDPGLDRRTVREWIDEAGLDDRSAGGLEALVRTTTYVDAPDQLSAGAAADQLRLGLRYGVRYLDGGWQTVVDALAERAMASGVRVHRGRRVRSLQRDGEVWVADAGDVTVAAGAVVIAAGGPQAASRLLALPDDAWSSDAVEAGVLDVVLDAVPRHPLVFATDAPLYLSMHAPTAALLTGGGALVTALRYHRPGAPVPSPDDVRAQLLAHLAVCGADQGIRATRYLHRLTVAGSLPRAEAGGLGGRPPVAVPDRPAALLAGDWVGPTGMLADASAASGVAAGRAAAEVALSSARPVPLSGSRRR